MSWQEIVKSKIVQWKEAYQEAVRRDKSKAQELKDRGYTFDGAWKTPDGCPMFDGPGSHVSVFAHLDDVIKERGMEKDIDALKGYFDYIRK